MGLVLGHSLSMCLGDRAEGGNGGHGELERAVSEKGGTAWH